MECLSLSKGENGEPALSVLQFEQRCKSLAGKFCDLVGVSDGGIIFVPDISNEFADMAIAGRDSELVARNRGRQHRVVRLCSIVDDVFAWTGYFERWRKVGKEQRFRFVTSGFTVHIGRQGDVVKPQLLRSEWVGRRSSAFVDQAGHPHWQLDALESARGEENYAPVRFAEPPAELIVQEFGAPQAAQVADNLLMGLTIERMHLASAALWWREAGMQLAHTPETVAELDRWILGCAAYLRQEISRCAIVGIKA